MAAKHKAPAKLKSVETLRYEDATRKNLPTAEHQSVIEQEQAHPMRVAHERRNRDLVPHLVWRGKDEQDWSDLVVSAPPRSSSGKRFNPSSSPRTCSPRPPATR